MLHAAAELPVPEHSPDDARRAAEEVLSRPEFQPEPESLIERILRVVFEWLGEVLDFGTAGGRGSAVTWVVLVAAIAVIVFVIVRFVPTLARNPRGRRLASAEEEEVPRLPAEEWRKEAERHAREGRWREAVRCRYRALVADLASRSIVQELPGRTAGEYRQHVAAAAPEAAGDFGQVTGEFERVWYGGHEPASTDYDRVRSLEGRVLEEAG